MESNLALAPSASDGTRPLESANDPAQFLTFQSGGEMFAIGILAIKEIIEFGGLTAVPMMPPSVRGVINLRGAVVPVIDLQARFGKPPTPIGRRTCIVIVEVRISNECQVIGVVVDAVNEVVDIAAADIEPAPPFGARIRTEFIRGMGKIRGRFVILLDIVQTLSIDDLDAIASTSPSLAAEP